MKILPLLLLLPVPAFAEEAAVKAVTEPAKSLATSNVSGQLAQLVLGLLLVIGLIFLLAWLVRRVQQITPRGGQVIQIVATQTLGPRDRLVLVQVGGEQVLIGLTPGRIAPLHVMAEPVSAASSTQASGDFAQRLMQALGKQSGNANKDVD
ncbi:Flagellar protein FliO [Pseudomonas marincola]|uniref:Flagellar protein n=1 Tax=Pseudomonas marincola TaxID=437900 RepID=A0A653E6M8_9PSED|nr:flagellar biosynthetic protein FliO [Pseudomonas marincola]CAE6908553.1 Flagellar protein FliO [Pseudomonas marincola]